MKGSELTLVFFTLLTQTAVGMLLAFGIINNLTGFKSELANSKLINDKILFLTCAVLTAAVIISFLHLGNIKNAIYVLNNFSTSWLSREILFVLIFGALTVCFTFGYSKNLLPHQFQMITLSVTILSGLVLVFAMSKLYMLEAVPAWNSIFTPASFYLSSIILGGLTFLASALFLIQRQGASIPALPGLQNLVKMIIGIIVLLLLAELIVWLIQTVGLSNGERAAQESFEIIFKGHIILFIGRILLQGLGLYLLTSLYFSLGKGVFNINYLFAGAVLIFFAEVFGRYLFYLMYSRAGV